MILIIHGVVVILVDDGRGCAGAGGVATVGVVLLLSIATITNVSMVIRMKRIMQSINLSVIIVFPK